MLAQNNLVIGLTGSIASGCKIVADYLEENHGFVKISLTDVIRKEAKINGVKLNNRESFQNYGDALRHEKGLDYLVKESLSQIKANVNKGKNIIIKSFRNNHEVISARKNILNFYLINIDADKEKRFPRLKKKGHTTRKEFEKDDTRDSGKGQPEYGQQVRKCVDEADIVINNTDSKNILYKKINHYLGQLKNPSQYKPTPDEINMAHAWQQSTQSGCIKRYVGAVITKGSQIIASGYNSTTENLSPCRELQVCYRDYAKHCEKCGKPLVSPLTLSDGKHPCGKLINKDLLEAIEKNLDLCRAIHAEEKAILQSAKFGGADLKDTTLYTTTFPCMLCAKKIVEVGIKNVVYIDPYPYEEAHNMFKDGGVKTTKFEGIKSRLFDIYKMG